jgi:molecular chaperone DnaK
VTPLSLGIETLGGVMTKLIDRNTTIPTRKSELFTTAADNQTSVEVHVLQGERQLARDSRTLGRFHLVGIPSAPRGIPQIEVAFDIDANGILNVAAKDLATNKEQKITITASSGLTKDDIEQMVKDSERCAEDDKKRREEIEVRNQLDSMCYQTEKMLGENREKLPIAELGVLEAAINTAKEALKGEEIEKQREALDQLTKASHRLAELLYQQAQNKQTTAGEQAQGEPSQGAPEGGVVDAEFEDLGGKSDKK